MSKRKPIGAVGKERVVSVCDLESLINPFSPGQQMNGLGKWTYRSVIKQRQERINFGFEWEGRDAAKHQSNDEQSKPEADTTKMVRLRHECRQDI